ncbi:GGDEF domain-containing protein [Nautilia sp. PV-1]|nr:GGDEF domain-containing protein [Nautilia sp. PV-1]
MEHFEYKLDKMLQSLLDSGIINNLNNSFNSEEQIINFLDQIINSTIEGLIVFDENKKCIRANKSASYIFGYTPEEMIGKFAFEFVADDSKELVKNRIKIKDQSPYEAYMVKKDGTKFPAMLRGRDILINGKKIRISAIIDLSELKAKEEEIYTIAYYDKLTGLPNRQKMISDMNKMDRLHSCVIFNIDKFGQINDLFGSAIGDKLLIKFAEELKNENTHPYRIGGDEFAILFDSSITYKDLKLFIEKIIDKIEKMEFLADNEPFHIHIRAGAAINKHKLLTHADIAVREAKRKKIPYQIYDESLKIEEKYKKNLEMTVAIHKALQNNGILCYYQPIFNKDGEIVKYEVLVRMRDEKGNIILPGEFLPIAKTTKLYTQITRQVVRCACNSFASIDKSFNINISIDDINNPELVEYIINTIKKTGTGEKIGFEILETEGIENYDIVKKFIDKVKALGATVAIDDFGSGYSNFKHIFSLNIDCIKLDGSLIKEVYKQKKNLIVVETIINFASKIGAKTVAEFVCCKEVFDAIKNLGIDYFQGFYFGKPSPEIVKG